MNATSLGTAMRRFAAVALVLAVAPIARGYVVDAGVVADQATGKHAGAAAVILAQGRCSNGRCR
jgi:hypothetical protein